MNFISVNVPRVSGGSAASAFIKSMDFSKVRVSKVSGGRADCHLVKVGNLDAFGPHGAANSLYNMDGGHGAVVFNRIYGIKGKARMKCVAQCVLFTSFEEMEKKLEQIENKLYAISTTVLEIKKVVADKTSGIPKILFPVIKGASLSGFGMMIVTEEDLELIDNKAPAALSYFLGPKRMLEGEDFM